MEGSPVKFDRFRENIEEKLLGLQLSLSNNEEINYEDLRAMLTQMISIDPETEVQQDRQNTELILDTPFKWKPISEKNAPSERIKAALEKKKGYANEKDCQWCIIILNLVMCYENMAHINDPETAMKLLVECDRMIEECKNGKDFMVVNKIAFRRVIESSRFYMSQDLRERNRIVAELQPHAELSQDVIAAIWGIRGAVHMEYGISGNKLAEMYLHTAIKFNPDVAEWHFLYGQCLGRLRHVNFNLNLPQDIELVSLERAVELSKNPYFITYLAQAFREAASSLFWQQKSSEIRSDDVEKTIDRMNKRALELYEDVLELCPNCPFINVRCAQGFMRFRGEYRNYERAYECCKKSIEILPANTMVNHVWGQINERLGNNKVASTYLRIASSKGAFGAYMDLIRLNFKMNKYFDPRPLLLEMINKFPEDPYQIEVNVQLGSYFYFKCNEVVKAAEYIMKAVEIDPFSSKLTCHRSILPQGRPYENVYIILVEASRLLSEEERNAKYGRVISICKANFPDILEAPTRVRRTTSYESVRSESGRGSQYQRNGGNWRTNQQGDGKWQTTKDVGNAKLSWRDPKSRQANVGIHGYANVSGPPSSYSQRNWNQNSRNGGKHFNRRGDQFWHNGNGNGMFNSWGQNNFRSSECSSQRSDYGSDRDNWSENGSIKGGSGYDSETGSYSDYGSVRSLSRNSCTNDIGGLVADMANQRLDNGYSNHSDQSKVVVEDKKGLVLDDGAGDGLGNRGSRDNHGREIKATNLGDRKIEN